MNMAQKPDVYDYIRFAFCDLYGIVRGKLIPRNNIKNCMDNGLALYAGATALGPHSQVVIMRQVEERNHCNCIFKPFLDTLHQLTSLEPESSDKIGQILCEPQWMDGTPLKADPRFVARTQLQNLSQLDTTLLSGYEMEFAILEKEVDKPLFDGCEVFNFQILRRHQKLMLEIHKSLDKANVSIDGIQTEYGPGQFELSLTAVNGIQSADNAFILKNCVKEICDKHNLNAYFMAKPFEFTGNNGCHYNHSLVNKSDGSSAFGDTNGKLSEIGKHWIAGLLEHMGALTALCCPTPNCYHRVGEPWAPDSASWGYEDRLSTIRVKTGSNGNIYIENRLPSGAANVYLVMAGTVAAGLDGIHRKLELPSAGNNARPAVPRDLNTALDHLEKDQVLVKALGAEFIEWYLKTKREIDLKEFPPESYHGTDKKTILQNERQMYNLL